MKVCSRRVETKTEEAESEDELDFDFETFCVVCFELYQDPIILDCNHVFCKKCCHGMSIICQQASLLICPLCRAITPWSEHRPLVVTEEVVGTVAAAVAKRDAEVISRDVCVPEALTATFALLLVEAGGPKESLAPPGLLEDVLAVLERTETTCEVRMVAPGGGSLRKLSVQLERLSASAAPPEEGANKKRRPKKRKKRKPKGAALDHVLETGQASITLTVEGSRSRVKVATAAIRQVLVDCALAQRRKGKCKCSCLKLARWVPWASCCAGG